MEQHETYASIIIVERHRTILETGGRGGGSLIPAATLSRKELLARTYEVGVTIIATLGGLLGIPRKAGRGLGGCRVPAPASTPSQ